MNNSTGLYEAMETASMIKLLLKYGADIEAQANHDERALHLAARCGNFGAVRLLLEKGADIEAPDKCKKTALHHAVRHAEVTKVLREKGANFEALNDDGQTASDMILQDRWMNEQEINFLADFHRKRQQQPILGSPLSFNKGGFAGPI